MTKLIKNQELMNAIINKLNDHDGLSEIISNIVYEEVANHMPEIDTDTDEGMDAIDDALNDYYPIFTIGE